ncbi:MAG TPA: diguanylate cyclase [Methylomirabilota bacterium]|nr:diguanylate cyclase [Methylomirabilota bacterium]
MRFWGTRGSIASPGPATAQYGGNTSCVEVRGDDGTVIVLDCGTGARGLGIDLVRRGGALCVNLFIGHTHWDHIQGFPFFVPAFVEGVDLNIFAPTGFQRGLEEAMAGQMEYSYFPVKLRDLRSTLHFTELEEGFFRVGDLLVETQYLNHTAPTIAYKISGAGGTLAYVTDHEPFWPGRGPEFEHPGDQGHVAFLRGADLVIHDAQYTEEEYPSRVGWGHSTIEYAIAVARAAGVRRLALFHHDPSRDDAEMQRLEARARGGAIGEVEVFAGREGLELEVRGAAGVPSVASASALSRRPIAGGRVLVVSPNDAEVAAIEELLAIDDLEITAVVNGRAALARCSELEPDVAIVDARLPDGDGVALAAQLAATSGRAVPVLILAEQGMASPTNAAGTADWLAKPFSPPMLHTRVRAWLSRSLAAAAPPDVRPAAAREASVPGHAIAVTADHAALLGDMPLFRALSGEERERLVDGATEHAFGPGQVIIGEGEVDDRVFVVLAGRVRIIESMPEALSEAVLGGLGEGEVFGELSILTGRPRSATVLAVERTRCLAIHRDRFTQALESYPGLAVGLLRVLARRLIEADRRLARYAPDALTGLASRRALQDQYRRMAAAARRRKTGVLLLVFDVLRLRGINDRFGYVTGDEVLRTVADGLREVTRLTDLVARCGADEFAVLALDAGLREAELLITRIGERLKTLTAQRVPAAIVQLSMGIASREDAPDSLDELFRAADKDMRRGRVI